MYKVESLIMFSSLVTEVGVLTDDKLVNKHNVFHFLRAQDAFKLVVGRLLIYR